MTASSLSPFTVEVTRGPAVESRHAVHAVVMNGEGEIVAAFGDARRPTFPRSAIKPLQALALVESGAADAFNLSDAELALACASHSGEEKHTKAVAAWLSRLGLDESALECGAHAPYAAPESLPSILCNNCSGKHTGMVTLSLFLKKDHAGYTNFSHPVQETIFKTMGEMCGTEITPSICGVDGCSAPNPCLSLENIARGFSAFMTGQGLSKARAAACHRLFGAMTQYPDLVGGTGRLDTLLMQAGQGKILSKTGAEGVYACVAPARSLVIVLKAEDGAKRAAEATLYALMDRFHIAGEDVLETIRPVVLPVLKNWRGIEVGTLRV